KNPPTRPLRNAQAGASRHTSSIYTQIITDPSPTGQEPYASAPIKLNTNNHSHRKHHYIYKTESLRSPTLYPAAITFGKCVTSRLVSEVRFRSTLSPEGGVQWEVDNFARREAQR